MLLITLSTIIDYQNTENTLILTFNTLGYDIHDKISIPTQLKVKYDFRKEIVNHLFNEVFYYFGQSSLDDLLNIKFLTVFDKVHSNYYDVIYYNLKAIINMEAVNSIENIQYNEEKK